MFIVYCVLFYCVLITFLWEEKMISFVYCTCTRVLVVGWCDVDPKRVMKSKKPKKVTTQFTYIQKSTYVLYVEMPPTTRMNE